MSEEMSWILILMVPSWVGTFNVRQCHGVRSTFYNEDEDTQVPVWF